LWCRHYRDIFEKLGGDEEASRSMGELLAGVGSLLASEAAVSQVPLHKQQSQTLAVCYDLIKTYSKKIPMGE
jgi:hypothetical protein